MKHAPLALIGLLLFSVASCLSAGTQPRTPLDVWHQEVELGQTLLKQVAGELAPTDPLAPKLADLSVKIANVDASIEALLAGQPASATLLERLDAAAQAAGGIAEVVSPDPAVQGRVRAAGIALQFALGQVRIFSTPPPENPEQR